MPMHNAFHPKSNVDHLYILRKEGSRRLQGVEEMVNLTNLGLENYVKESRECLLTTARSVDIDLLEPIQETTTEAKKQKKEERTIFWEDGHGMANLCAKLRKWGVKIGGSCCEIGL